MARLLSIIMPPMLRKEVFFELFNRSTQNMVKTAQKLKELVNNWDNIEARVKEITELEHEGDSITHQIMAQLHRTFVTPFDREDISLLAHTMDDVTDFIHAAADAMLLYKVAHPQRRAKELADTIVQGAAEIEKAVSLLHQRSKLNQILEHCVEVNRLENVADEIYRAAIAELFGDTTDMAEVIKWREIYEHMETATDRGEDVANVLEGIALKHA